MNHREGIIEERGIWEASGRHLGSNWEASGSIWEASGRHPGGVWEASGTPGGHGAPGGSKPQKIDAHLGWNAKVALKL